MKNISFGIHLSQECQDYHFVKNMALKAEELAFDQFTLVDHIYPMRHTQPMSDEERYSPSQQMLEPLVTLTALAMDTKKIRIGPLVFCVAFRLPQILAKMAATLDVISKGRLFFSIGAGWFEREYKEFGIPFEKPKTRIERLREGTMIIKKLWSEDKATFHGRYYRIDNAGCYPKPIQKPYPPIAIGGSGEKYTLRVVAELADEWNAIADDPSVLKRKFAVLANHCHDVGRDFDEIAKSYMSAVFIGEDEKDIHERMKARALRINRSVDEYKKGRIHGTPEQCFEIIKQLVDIGFTKFYAVFPELPNTENLEIFAKDVLTKF
ncbi:MAG: TIGR03560 family F420-dependent LLM class oxidoreductase [Candidatus Hodarchaeota archaeon]